MSSLVYLSLFSNYLESQTFNLYPKNRSRSCCYFFWACVWCSETRPRGTWDVFRDSYKMFSQDLKEMYKFSWDVRSVSKRKRTVLSLILRHYYTSKMQKFLEKNEDQKKNNNTRNEVDVVHLLSLRVHFSLTFCFAWSFFLFFSLTFWLYYRVKFTILLSRSCICLRVCIYAVRGFTRLNVSIDVTG